MKKLSYFLGITLFLFTACQPQEKSVNDMTEEELVEYARGIHDRVITLDTHDDINTNNFTEDNNYTKKLPTQVNLPNMIEGGLDVAWFIVYTGQGELTDEGFDKAYANADDKFKAIHRLAEEIAPDQIEIALTSDDVRRIAASGKKVAMIGIENGYPVGKDISRVKEFYERGARYMSLAHNGHSQLSDSNTGERDSVWLHNGLSELGKEVIREMNKWGIMIDLSHPSKVANMQMMEMSKAPVIASHSSARALNNVSRNLDDEQLMMLKENGGVVQTVAFKSYLNSEKNTANRKKSSEIIAQIAEEEGFEIKPGSLYRAMSRNERTAYFDAYNAFQEKHKDRIDSLINSVAPPVDVADFVDHIDYLVNKIGIEHVGISSDFDGGGGVEGWSDASETFNVTLELVRRGYSEKEIGMIWSGNLLRVLDEVQAVAQEIQEGE
ncbi:dipeptidase [Roseivirga misakiensis]|uniref:Peptidase M19 n=1 Tax=Roseivirga misakiensis TaxID=1563681 RepID=A0A1E5SZV6_9BACT|nr:dipeptidase [Roseivirga misakiensis]OEK04663.1 peptidase M19 [Roseivirga misakiensis]